MMRLAASRAESILCCNGAVQPGSLISKNDLHEFDPVGNVWRDLSAPTAGVPPDSRWGHGSAVFNNILYVFGGMTSGLMHCLYISSIIMIPLFTLWLMPFAIQSEVASSVLCCLKC